MTTSKQRTTASAVRLSSMIEILLSFLYYSIIFLVVELHRFHPTQKAGNDKCALQPNKLHAKIHAARKPVQHTQNSLGRIDNNYRRKG
jgi:hypothetical protein